MENTTTPTSVTELQTQLQCLETELAELGIKLCRPIYTDTPRSLENLQTELQTLNKKLAELGINILPHVSPTSAASCFPESEGTDRMKDLLLLVGEGRGFHS